MPLPAESELLPELLAICQRAGAAIMDVYRSDFDVQHKDDESPLTEADLAAHRIIKTGLASLAPELPLLSEEGSETPYEQRRHWDSYWLVDPLDGTREFVKKNGEFTVNIALMQEHAPIAGVVYAPALEKSYFAGPEGGAKKQIGNEAPQAIRVRKISDADTPRVLLSRSHGNERQAQFLERLGDYTPMSVGSSLKFCLIAEGEADFYPRLGPTSEWDTAAGQAVLNRAGGKVTQTDFTPLRYNAEESLLNPEFLVIGDASFGWERYF